MHIDNENDLAQKALRVSLLRQNVRLDNQLNHAQAAMRAAAAAIDEYLVDMDEDCGEPRCEDCGPLRALRGASFLLHQELKEYKW